MIRRLFKSLAMGFSGHRSPQPKVQHERRDHVEALVAPQYEPIGNSSNRRRPGQMGYRAFWRRRPKAWASTRRNRRRQQAESRRANRPPG